MTNKHIRIALIQDAVADNAESALWQTETKIKEAAQNGAKIVCTKELFNTSYFCKTQDPALFDLAELVPGPTTTRLAKAAAENNIVVIASLFEKRAPGVYHNTAAIIDADGTYLGSYRKMHIPQDPGFEEKFYFTPGDLGFRVWDTKAGRLGVIICWDQWFPEASRLCALQGAEIIFCPTAIGRIYSESAELAQLQRAAWLNVQKGHAVANGCYYAAVNRVGIEGETEFWGTSFVADFYGELIAEGSQSKKEIVLADCDMKALEDHRRMWPFFRDRRTDAFADLSRRFIDV